MNIQNQNASERVQRSIVVENDMGNYFQAQSQAQQSPTYAVTRTIAGTSQSQEIYNTMTQPRNVEVRRSFVVTPVQDTRLSQSGMIRIPMQQVQAPVQYQTMQMPYQTVQMPMQMPMQYVQVAMPMQNSQIIQATPVQMPEQKVIIERNDGEIILLQEENKRLRLTLEEWKLRLLEFERRGPQIVEKIVERPVEIVRVDETRIRELESQLDGHRREKSKQSAMRNQNDDKLRELEEELRRSRVAIEEWKSKAIFLEMQGPKIIEKRVEVPIEVIKVVEKKVEVPVEVVKFDDRRIRELENIIEEWRSKAIFLERQGPKIIEKKIEVPVEIIKKEVVVDDRRIRELEGELNFFREENRKIKISIEEWRSKVSFFEMQGPKIVEKRVEVPVEVVKYIDKRVEVPVEVV